MKIALIAHDKKKNEIIELAKKYKDVLGKYKLYATGTTGTLIMGETGLKITRMKSGPKGIAHNSGAFAYAYIVPILCPFFAYKKTILCR